MCETKFIISIFTEPILKTTIALETWGRWFFFEKCWKPWSSSTDKPERRARNMNHWIGRVHVTSARSISGKTDFWVFNVEWSARSPDLSHIEFYLWSYLKEIVKKYKPCYRQGDNKHWFRSRESRHRKYEENGSCRTVSNQEVTTLKTVVFKNYYGKNLQSQDSNATSFSKIRL